MTKLSYEESRLAFFKQQLAGANRKLDWAINHKSHWDCAEKGEIVSFYQDIVEMLREQAEREKGCEYCNTTQNRYLTDDIYMATTNSYGDKQRVLTSNNGVQYKTLGFCPMCGRRLEAQHE